ncbi:hypothetical protein [Streptomyces sp. NPDC020996]|uniref:hypothetical protein n=1 Tax=Streptomyces sp. NPDC020996 TaxID=3154791 RepID=UPI003407112C
MDLLETLNANLSHGLTVELTVYDTDLDRQSTCAYQWLTDGVRQIGGERVLLSAGQGRISSKGFTSVPAMRPRGDFSRWSYVWVAPQDTLDVLYNPYTSDVLPWIRRVIEDRPESISVESGKFVELGEIGDTDIFASVVFEEELPEYVKLLVYPDEADLLAAETAQRVQDRLVQSVRWACERYNVVFGHVSYRHALGMTELERFLRGEDGSPISNTPRWRSQLRGYSWLMVISSDIAHLLGGVETLRDSRAFHSISTLPNGSLLLQATPTFREYRGPAVEKVYDAVRKVLVTGEFRTLPPIPGIPPANMVVLPD